MATVWRFLRRQLAINPPVPQVILDRINPLEAFSDEGFRERFRLRKETVLDVVNELDLGDPRGPFVPPVVQLCMFLLWAANGCFFRMIGDIIGTHGASVSRILKRVSLAIIRIARRWIHMPRDKERAQVKRAFFAIAGKWSNFPNTNPVYSIGFGIEKNRHLL